MENQKKSGRFQPKEKFIQFIGVKGNVNFISNEAIIEGKQLSGLEMEDKSFKLTIYEDGTVDLDDVGTQHTDEQRKANLLDIITEKTIVPFRKRMVVRELTFTSVQEVNDKKVSLYLSVDYQKPIDKLASIFDDEIEVSDEQQDKLDKLMSLFDDFDVVETETNSEIVEIESEQVKETVDAVDVNKHLEESFLKMKQEKVEGLKKDLQKRKTDLVKLERDKNFAISKIEECNADIRLLESRIDSLQPVSEPNGWYFNVSQRLNEQIVLEKDIYEIIKSKVSKVKGINSEAFMKLFEDGEFQIRLAKKSESGFDEIKNISEIDEQLITDLKLTIREDKIYYIGEIVWAELVNKFIKMGFSQDPDWDKICNSNSYAKIEETI